MIRSLFAHRRTLPPAVRPPVPTPADLHADSLRRYAAGVTPALTAPAETAAPPRITPVRGSYKVTYKLRGRVTPEPITTSDVDAIELAAEITTDLIGLLGTSDVKVTVDLGQMGGLIRAHGMNVGTFDLAPAGGAR